MPFYTYTSSPQPLFADDAVTHCDRLKIPRSIEFPHFSSWSNISRICSTFLLPLVTGQFKIPCDSKSLMRITGAELFIFGKTTRFSINFACLKLGSHETARFFVHYKCRLPAVRRYSLLWNPGQVYVSGFLKFCVFCNETFVNFALQLVCSLFPIQLGICYF